STMKKINIVIDGPTAVDKTTIGSALANSLKYRFIDSGIFYHYLGYLSYQYLDTENNSKTIKIFKKNVTEDDELFKSITELINSLGNEDYYLSGKEGAKISKNQEARQIINQYIHQITKGKEFVVVGRDVTFNILSDTEVKIVLSADIDIRVQHHSLQINSTDIKNIFTDILYHDYFSFKQLEQAKKISTIIDTTNIDSFDVIKKIFSIIQFYLCNYKFNFHSIKMLKKLNKRSISEVEKDEENSSPKELINSENWELNNTVNNNAFAEAFPNIGERMKFMKDLLLYYEARKTIFILVDRKLPKDRDHEFFEEIIE
ncbi:17915_t:CDS:2, partial [Dentiscutata erythropus]